MTTAGDFFDLNAQQRLQRKHPNIHKLRPGVVRRVAPAPEPDRSHVEGYTPPKSALDELLEEHQASEPPKQEAPPVAAKKKRAKVDSNTRAVAVARVDKLVEAGNPAGKAIATVAKELGVSESAVINWRTQARKGPKPAKKRASKKARRAAAPNGHAETVPDGALLGDRFVQLVADSVAPIVRAIVREEIRRMLS